MKINFPIRDIVIELGQPDPDNPGAFLGGKIISGGLNEDDCYNYINYYMMDAIESVILAHACAGIDIINPAYLKGIKTVVDAHTN